MEFQRANLERLKNAFIEQMERYSEPDFVQTLRYNRRVDDQMLQSDFERYSKSVARDFTDRNYRRKLKGCPAFVGFVQGENKSLSTHIHVGVWVPADKSPYPVCRMDSYAQPAWKSVAGLHAEVWTSWSYGNHKSYAWYYQRELTSCDEHSIRMVEYNLENARMLS